MPLKNFFFRNLKWLFFCHFAKLPCILPFFEIECYCYCFEFDFSSTENSGWVERARKLSQDVGPPNSASQQLLDENPKHAKSVWWKIKENLKSELLFDDEHREIKIDNFFWFEPFDFGKIFSKETSNFWRQTWPKENSWRNFKRLLLLISRHLWRGKKHTFSNS